MILISCYEKIKNHVDEIFSLGYGYSSLSEPIDNATYNIGDVVDMLRDWGWTGEKEEKPEFL